MARYIRREVSCLSLTGKRVFLYIALFNGCTISSTDIGFAQTLSYNFNSLLPKILFLTKLWNLDADKEAMFSGNFMFTPLKGEEVKSAGQR